jgi:hypothetical protein
MRRRCTSSSYSATTDDRLDLGRQCCPQQNQPSCDRLAIAGSRDGFFRVAMNDEGAVYMTVTEE